MESVQPAFDSHPSADAEPQLTEEAVAVLRAALDNVVAGRYPAWSAALNDALKRICIDARRSDWPPEQLLIAFKSALYALPSVQHLTRGPERDEFVSHLVSLCIDEYSGKPQRSGAAW
jgi:hypothetical protein